MYNLAELETQLLAAGIPVTNVRDVHGEINLSYTPEVTPAEIAQAAGIVATFIAAHQEALEVEEARELLRVFRTYVKKQLVGAASESVEQIFNRIQPAVLGNVILTRAMTRWLTILRLSEGWTPSVAVIMAGATDDNRARYIRAAVTVELVLDM